MKEYQSGWLVTLTLVIVSVVILVGIVAGWANFRVYTKELSGKADLREAEWSRQIQIEEAQANLESEKLNAQAEVERAKGAAEAIQIEGGSLTTEYIQYLWVRSNNFNENTTIYVPTETNLPILEANRLK